MGNSNELTMSPWATAGVGAGMGLVNNVSNLVFGGAMQKQQLKGYEKSLKLQNDAAYDLWQRTNYGAQMKELSKAGLNPGLLYGMGGGGGGTTGGGGGMPSGGQAAQGMDIKGAVELALLNAQRENIEADTENKRATTPNINQDTQNKVLEGIIKDYTGREAKLAYQISEATQLDKYGAATSELDARKWTADTIVRLGESGQLEKKSLEEIEGLVLSNAKSRAERKNIEKNFELLEEQLKGKKMENVMTDLELRLQKATGIDRNSPVYFKMLGRLIVELMNK